MPSEVAVLGPFVGGLNKASDASAIADNELSICNNFNLDLDGSLVCRLPIKEHLATTVDFSAILMIGTSTIGDDPTLLWGCIHSGGNAGVYNSSDGVSWTFITNVISYKIIQFHSVVLILAAPESSNNGGTWTPSGGFIVDNNLPRACSGVFYKSRLWLAPGFSATGNSSTSMRFSEPINPSSPTPVSWTSTNDVPVGYGDGQPLVDIIIDNDNLMLFKSDSTYAFAFDLRPQDAILRKINNDIGVSGQRNLVSHENSLYLMHKGKVYHLQNFTFTETNVKVPFLHEDDPNVNVRWLKTFICLIGDLLLVRYFNSMYCLNLITKTWSTWSSTYTNIQNVGPFIELKSNDIINKPTSYFSGSSLNTVGLTYEIKEDYTATDVETSAEGNILDIVCTAETKIFDIGIAHQFKRLMWWGIDVISDGEVTGIAIPQYQTTPVTWEMAEEYSWSQLGPWDSLLQGASSVFTEVDDPFDLRRKFIKMLKSLRFRQISFRVFLHSNGSVPENTALGPARLFSISAILGVKQTVVKQVS